MANQITGRITEIGQIVQIPSKNGGSPFTKREFILDATTYDPYTGERSEYENIIPLEFSGDKCAELDRFNQGDVVTISFVLQGRSWTNLDGEFKRMASIRCYKNRSAWRCIAIPTNCISTAVNSTTRIAASLSTTAAELFTSG